MLYKSQPSQRVSVRLGVVLKSHIQCGSHGKAPERTSELLLCCFKDFGVIKDVLECSLIKVVFIKKTAVHL